MTKSPNPADGSKEISPLRQVWGVGENERRRVYRMTLTSEQFRLEETGKVFSVSDLSDLGMAVRILAKDDFEHFTVGRTLSGNLNLKREKYPVTLKVRNIRGDTVGCEFEEMPREAKTAISNFLDPKNLGKEMKLVPAPEGAPAGTLWFHAPTGADLLVTEKEGDADAVSEFSLFIFGNYVHWSAPKGLITGSCSNAQELGHQQGMIRQEELLLQMDSELDDKKLKMARVLIENSPLPGPMAAWAATHLDAAHSEG